jgi:hypothetical protein
MKEKIGFCGLYCGCCTMYRAYHDNNPKLLKEAPKNFRQRFDLENATVDSIACDGCRSSKPLDYCEACEIRNCAQQKRLKWCFECDEFPCQRLYRFESFWRMPVFGNLNQISMVGVDKWLAIQEQEWNCNACDAKLHWFSFGICSQCGFENPDPGIS